MGISIGELTGELTLEDRFSSVLEMAADKAKESVHEIEGVFGALAIGAAAVVGAFVGITGSIIMMAKSGSEMNDIATGLDRLAGSADNAHEIMETLLDSVKNTVDDMDLMKFANQALARGAIKTAEDFGTVGKAARVLSREGFGPITNVMDQISNAMTTGRVRSLQFMTGIIDLKGAEEKYAKSLGTTRGELTTRQRLIADQHAIIEKLNSKVKEAGELELSFSERVRATNLAIGNYFDDIAQAVAKLPSINQAWDAISESIVKNFGGAQQTLADFIVEMVDKFAKGVAHWGPIVIDWFAKMFKAIRDGYEDVTKFWDAIPDWLKSIALEAGLAYIALNAVATVVETITAAKVISGITMALEAMIPMAVKIGGVVNAIRNFVASTALVYQLGGVSGLLAAVGDAFAAAGAGIMTFMASSTGIAALLIALGLAAYKAAQGIEALYQWWKQGKPMWDFFTQKDDGNWVRRLIGWSNAQDDTAESLKRLADQRKAMEGLMGSRTGSGPGYPFTGPKVPMPGEEEPPEEKADHSKEIAEATKKSIDKTKALWEAYFTGLEKDDADTRGAQIRGIERWYSTELTELNKSKSTNANYYNELTALSTSYYQKLEDAEIDFIEKSRQMNAEGVAAVNQSFQKNATAMRTWLQTMGAIPLDSKPLQAQWLKLGSQADDVAAKVTEAMNRASRATVPLTQETKDYITELKNVGYTAQEIADILGLTVEQVTKQIGGGMAELDGFLKSWEQELVNLAQISGGKMGEMLTSIAQIVNAYNQAADAAKNWADATTLAGKALSAFQMVSAVASATAQGSQGQRTVGGALAGARAGMAFGPIGAGVGAAIGGIVGFIRGMHQEEKQVNDMRDAFQSTFGAGVEGLKKMNQAAMEATGSLQLVQNLLNAKNVEDYTKAQDALTAALDHQKEVAAAIEEVAGPSQEVLDANVKIFQDAYEQMRKSGKYTTDELAAMWDKVTEAQRRAAHDPTLAMEEMARDAGYQTQEELVEAARKAEKLAEYMRDSGKYSAEAVKDAFDKAGEAADRALGINLDALNKLKSEYEDLNKSVSAEAAEADMGSVEKAQRERMEQIKREMEAEQARIDDLRKRAMDEDTTRVIENAKKAGDAVSTAITDGITKLPKDWGKDFAKDAFGSDFDQRVDTASGYARSQMQTAGADIEAAFQQAGAGMKDHIVDSADQARKHIDDSFRGLSFTVDIHWNVDDLPRPNLRDGEQPEREGEQPEPLPMAQGGFGHADGPMTFSTKGDEDFAFSSEGKTFADLFKASQQKSGPITIQLLSPKGAVLTETVLDTLETGEFHERGGKIIRGMVRK